MNIFRASCALGEIEDQVKKRGLPENQVILFHMWLSDDRFPGHNFDDGFTRQVLRDLDGLMKEFDEWAHKEAMRTLRSEQEPW